ncbi:MAG: hypothetical protein WC995_13530 [Lysobacteraceae bacterium]
MRRIVTFMLLLVAAIHLLPLAGALGAEQLGRLYGTPISDPDLLILMRHRAVLFGLLGGFLAGAAFVRAWQPLALVAGLVSVGSFLLIAWLQGGYNAEVGRVVAADIAAGVCLLIALAAFCRSRRTV